MAEGSPDVVVPPKRTDERYELLADLTLDILIERLRAKTATAAEIAQARELVKQSGVKIIVAKETKGGKLVDNLPRFDDEDDGPKESVLANGVVLRTG